MELTLLTITLVSSSQQNDSRGLAQILKPICMTFSWLECNQFSSTKSYRKERGSPRFVVVKVPCVVGISVVKDTAASFVFDDAVVRKIS